MHGGPASGVRFAVLQFVRALAARLPLGDPETPGMLAPVVPTGRTGPVGPHVTASYWISENAGEAVGSAFDHVAVATGRHPLVRSTRFEEITVFAGSAAYDPSKQRPNSYTVLGRR